jgi:hypothetical protein
MGALRPQFYHYGLQVTNIRGKILTATGRRGWTFKWQSKACSDANCIHILFSDR